MRCGSAESYLERKRIECVPNREIKRPAIDEMTDLFRETHKRGLPIGKGGLGNAIRFTLSIITQ